MALLLLNDFVLKARFANWWTGKLSDVAGLAAFALFWTAMFPRARRVVFSVTALGFILWKSPLVTPALTWWNQFGIWPLQRVVDPTDDIALGILPLASLYATTIFRRTPRPSIFAAQLTLLIGALFSFTATSREVIVKDGTPYPIHASPNAVIRGLIDLGYPIEPEADGHYKDPVEIWLQDPQVTVLLSIMPSGESQTKITLQEFHDINTASPREVIRSAVERAIIYPLENYLASVAVRDGHSLSGAAKRCITLRIEGWHPALPTAQAFDRRWYTHPLDLALVKGRYVPFARLLLPYFGIWQPVILAPPITTPSTAIKSLDSTPERHSRWDSHEFLDAWVNPTPDSLILFGTDVNQGIVQSTLTIEGRWRADTLRGAARWKEYGDASSAPTSDTRVTGVRYMCIDTVSGVSAGRATLKTPTS